MTKFQQSKFSVGGYTTPALERNWEQTFGKRLPKNACVVCEGEGNVNGEECQTCQGTGRFHDPCPQIP